MVIDLIQEGISVYSTHTPFDKCMDGNNDFLGYALQTDIFGPAESGDGYVRVGEYRDAKDLDEVMNIAASQLGIDRKFFRYAGDTDVKIRKLCWVTGAGSDYMVSAITENCDLYVTGDLKYHDAQKAHELGINVLDLGHYATEKTFVRNMASLLKPLGDSGLEINRSELDLNPFAI